MDEKAKVKQDLQNTIKELDKLMLLKDDISSNWNDIIATTFTTKYKKIESDIKKLITELEDLQKLI